MKHLSDLGKNALKLPIHEKIKFLYQERWFSYPRATELLAILEDLFVFPKVKRMPDLLIVGDTNNGKTELVTRFEESHTIEIDYDTGDIVQPVVYITAPPTSNEGDFYSRLLDHMSVPYAKSLGPDKKRKLVIRAMNLRKTRLLIVDEIQHIIAGSENAQKVFLNSLKDFGNQMKIPIVGAGIEDAFYAIQVDEQLANRFHIEILPRWKMDSRETKIAFATLVKTLESNLPLPEPSNLFRKPYIDLIFYLSEGLIGEVAFVVHTLAKYAIKNELPCINQDVFDAVDLVPPSKRKGILKKLR